MGFDCKFKFDALSEPSLLIEKNKNAERDDAGDKPAAQGRHPSYGRQQEQEQKENADQPMEEKEGPFFADQDRKGSLADKTVALDIKNIKKRTSHIDQQEDEKKDPQRGNGKL